MNGRQLTFDVPPDADRGTCRSCGRPVAWIITAKGKKMPVDLGSGESHFATCPEAAKWRKPR